MVNRANVAYLEKTQPAVPASHIWAIDHVLTAVLLIQLPDNEPGKAVENGTYTRVGGLCEASGSSIGCFPSFGELRNEPVAGRHFYLSLFFFFPSSLFL